MAEIEKEAEPEKLPATLELAPALPAVTEKERDMANSAHQNFEKGKYESCVNTLSKLAVSRPHDPKVLLNKAVAEYYLSQSRKTEEFQKSMAEVCIQAHINIENVEALEDVDHCIIFFNQAVILYHLHQYYKAISILDKVFQFIEPLDENLARKVCFLLLELYLCSHQPEKALGLIGYIESMLFGGNKTNSNGKVQAGDKENEGGNKEKEVKESKENKESDEINHNEIYRPKLQQYKARCYIMLKSAKACKREIKSLMTSGMNIPAIFLRSQLEYLRGNYRKGLKVLNTAFSTAPANSFLETGDNLTAMYYNNVGCVHFYLGKPHLGCFYFNKALEEHNNVINSAMSTDEKSETAGVSRPIHTMNLTTRYQILYNLGLQYLHAGRPLQAFDCLVEAVQVYHTNPRLWLRIAECCIQVHKPDNSCDFQQAQKRKDIIQGIVGSGPNRKILLSPFLSNDNKVSVQGQSSAIPMATMEFASLCLSNALILLPEDPSPIPVTPTTTQSTTGDDASEGSQSIEGNLSSLLVLPANSIQGTEIASLRNSILAASSYVALCLGDVVMALKHAKTLLDQPKLCGAHRMLGHLYAAEALILMDSISDAVDQLNQDDVKDISLSLPTLTEEMKSGEKEDSIRPTGNLQNWFPNTLSTAKLVMQYNLTVAYTLRGEIDKASELLRLQLSTSKSPGVGIPFQAIMLAVYIQLQIGYADVAKNIIKQNSTHLR